MLLTAKIRTEPSMATSRKVGLPQSVINCARLTNKAVQTEFTFRFCPPGNSHLSAKIGIENQGTHSVHKRLVIAAPDQETSRALLHEIRDIPRIGSDHRS